MVMTYETTQHRPHLRVRLSGGEDSAIADDITRQWKTQRQCAPNLTRAILLYASLQAGDLSVLMAEFPLLFLQVAQTAATPVRAIANTAPQTTRKSSMRFAPAVILEDTDDSTLQSNDLPPNY